jgi:hypothetical protein
MPIPGNLLTTAMAVMPHTDVDRALALSLSLDIPFWPQLPRLSYYEDMYVQASEHFPGMVLDLEKRTLRFSMEKFLGEFEKTLERLADPRYLDISETYSAVYHRFVKLDLTDRPAIRGQLEGPISFGMNVVDQEGRPILYDDFVRPFMLEVMARRVNVQLHRLQAQNANAFMYIDEPGLQFLFSALSGYSDQAAKGDLEKFFSLIERPRGVHLCGNPDWDFLLDLDLDILSLDVYTNGEIFSSYARSIGKFLDRGGVLCWGIVPTHFEMFGREDSESLERRLAGLWENLGRKGIDLDLLVAKSLLSPATCCLINPDGEKTVEKAFAGIRELSGRLREKYKLPPHPALSPSGGRGKG